MNIVRKIAKESAIVLSGLVYGNANRYLFTVLLARWVGIEFLGIYSIANAIMMISEVLAKMGIETGIMRFVSRLNPAVEKEKIQRLIGSAVKMTAVFSIMIMSVLLLSVGFIVNTTISGSSLLTTVLIVFAIAIPFNTFTQVSGFATQGLKRLKYKTFVTQYLNPTTMLLVLIISFWFVSDKSALMAPVLVTGVVGFLAMAFILKRVTGIKNNQIINSSFNSDLLKFSYPLMFVTILQTFMHWMDILLLGYFTDAATVGLYHPAARTAGLLQALLFSFISIYAPIISQLHNDGKVSEIARICKLVSRWIMMLAIPIFLVFIIFPAKVMLLFGADFIVSAPVLVLLAIATFIQALLSASGTVLTMSGYTRLALWNSLVAFVLNIILNIILIPRYGIYGAAWATLISLTLISLLRVIQVRLIFKFHFIDYRMIKPIVAGSIVAAGLVYLKDFIMPYHTLITLLYASTFSVIIFGIVMWILKLEYEDREFLQGLKSLKGIFNKK
ncbi:polysaccharide biosynthesis C-terminal domain-containing protein [Candidatus Neomarinimicrobiota bacterium]